MARLDLDRFGAFGRLSGADGHTVLARALILAALNPQALGAYFGGAAAQRDDFVLPIAEAPKDPYSGAHSIWLDFARAEEALQTIARDATPASLARQVDALWGTVFTVESPPLRLLLFHVPAAHTAGAIVELLTTPDTRVLDALFAMPATQPLQWNWPIRIAVADDSPGQHLPLAFAAGRYRDLYEIVGLGDPAHPIDLLLVSPHLSSHGRRAIDSIQPPPSAVIDVAPVPPRAGASDILDAGIQNAPPIGLRGRCEVPEEEWHRWVNVFIRELSHNATLDRALFHASLGLALSSEGSPRHANLAWPVVAADPWFLEQSRIANTTLRIAKAMQRTPRAQHGGIDVAALGAQLVADAGRRTWSSELGDAREVVRKRRDAEASVGPLELDAIRWRDATTHFREPFGEMTTTEVDFTVAFESVVAPIPEIRKKESRYVQCELLAQVAGSPPAMKVKRVAARRDYTAMLHIGAEILPGAISADTALDESRLPPSPAGHELQIVFCPLAGVAREDGVVRTLARTIHLPDLGPSTKAEFRFSTTDEAGEFRARVLVMHKNRVLQSLLFAAPSPDADLQLASESRISPAFGASASEPEADLALVINDNPAGLPGILAVADGSASFSEPEGLKVSIETIEKLLSNLNLDVAAGNIELKDPRMAELCVQLASHGAVLMRELKRQFAVRSLANAARIQVTEARSKAYLPVEFVYEGKAPNPDAKLCPNAAQALKQPKDGIHSNCQHAGDPAHVCPAAFWGFSKCIERQPFGLTDQHVFRIPQPGADTLAPFGSALLAASSRVAEADLTGPNGVKQALESVAAEVRLVNSWDEWKAAIKTDPPPTLLVLLPHSDDSPQLVNIPALEIQKKWLASSQLDEDYVCTPPGDASGPLVLLLGCSTALADIAFLNFVREFKGAGASIVLGTLATVHGTHASRFARALLGALKAGGNGRAFDELLLETKQRLLADGEPFVLCLAAYGHSSWRIQA